MTLDIKDDMFTYNAFEEIGTNWILELPRYLSHYKEYEYCYLVIYVFPGTYLAILNKLIERDMVHLITYNDKDNAFLINGIPFLLDPALSYGEVKGVLCNSLELKKRCKYEIRE